MARKKADGPRYIVRRLNWQEPIPGRYFRLPGWHDLAPFPTLQEATADRWRRESFARSRINPFTCGRSIFELTTLPRPILYDWLLDADLTPPLADAPLPAWEAWWTAILPEMTDRQVDLAWTGFDKLRFFEVAEEPAGRPLFVVLLTHWERNENWVYEAAAEGGFPLFVGQTSSAADTYIHENLSDVWRMYDDEYTRYQCVETSDRVEALATEWPTGSKDAREYRSIDAPHSTVRQIPSAAPVRGKSVFIIARRSWHLTSEPNLWVNPTQYGRGNVIVPVEAYPSPKAATIPAWELDFVARMSQNPFRFGTIEQLSSFSTEQYASLLCDEGLTPPSGESQHEWANWWDATVDDMAPTQREAAWDLLDHLRFHQVVELPLNG